MFVKFAVLAVIAVTVCEADLPGLGDECVSECSEGFICVSGVGRKKMCECPLDTEFKDGACVDIPIKGESCTLHCQYGRCVKSSDSEGKFCCPAFYDYKDGSCQLLSCPEGTELFTAGGSRTCAQSKCIDTRVRHDCKGLENGVYPICFCSLGKYITCADDRASWTVNKCEEGLFKSPGMEPEWRRFVYDPVKQKCVPESPTCYRYTDGFYVGQQHN